ncbi:MAG: GNAT family N-acetyltransferase [Pleurocapsa sp. MO_192.B19]|nr:GNAT family N-acetyltransferase [Pleurocapsa sp. MO_192.B19]
MDNLTSFTLDNPNYLVKQLFPEDAPVLQKLYEQCNDFALLTDGVAFSPTAACEEFDTVPEGKTPEDNYIFGLFERNHILVGMIGSFKHYPDNQTWWLGMMMLAPIQRGQGLGTDFYRAFEHWLSAQGTQQISLCAIEANELGLRFWQKMGFKITRTISSRQFGIKTHKLYVLSRTAIAQPKSHLV